MRTRQPRFLCIAQVGQSEIDDLVDALPGRELVRHDVGRLQIAMHDAEIVRELQRRAERRHDRLHVREAHPSLGGDLLLDGGTVEQLHHQKRMVVVVHVEVEDRDDVRMAQPRAGAAFAEKAIARARSAVLAADDLDRDFVAKERPPRPIDRAHPTLGQERQDLVTIVEQLAGREHGSIRPYRFAAGCRG